jgi:hypothetical protein
VGFDYLPRGIKVGGAWYPVLKMEWVEGQLLSEYVERHVQNPAALKRLAERWAAMVAALERASMAHGDLQHGNVLVVNGDLKLVDYDGMWVPALGGRPGHEIGHQNYQHPGRTGADFGPDMDRFSAWVVYLSLVGLSVEPDLWDRLHGGDECLFLRRDDLADPASSTAMAALEAAPDQQVRAMAVSLRSFVAGGPSQVPSLAATLSGAAPARPNDRGRRLWRRGSSAGSGPMPDVQIPGAPVWVLDSLETEPTVPLTVGASVTLARGCAVFSAAIVVAASLPAAAPLPSEGLRLGAAVLLVVILNLSVLAVSFRREPAASSRRRIAATEREVLKELAVVRRRVERCERASVRLAAGQERTRARAAAQRDRLVERERRQRAAVEADGRAARASFDAKRADLDRRESDDLTQALKAAQERHVQSALRERRLWSAKIAGIGWSDKLRLWLIGVRCAAQVQSDKAGALQRIGEKKARALLAWRLAAEADARRSMPRRLEPDLRDAIRRRYSAQRELVLKARGMAETREQQDLRRLGARFGERYAAVESRLLALEEAAERRREELGAEVAEARQDEPRLHWRLAYLRRELEPYQKVTMPRYVLAVFTGR